MAADLSVTPWTRLARLAPQGTTNEALQEAADRHSLRADFFAAVADLWEDYAYSIDTAPDYDSGADQVQSVSQDGISVTYRASQGLAVSRRDAALQTAERFRRKSKARSVSVYAEDDDPWAPYNRYDESASPLDDIFIDITEE